MTTVRRFDAVSLSKKEKHDSGYLRVDGFIARTGIQEYARADGTIRRELRLPEEVFAPAAMRSFALVPVTNLHPPGLLTPETAKSYTVGAIGESVRQDGDHLAATMMIHDAGAMKAISEGRSKLSCGYSCEMDDTPGVWNGQKYDSIQRNIRGNHLALVDVPRAGLTAALRLDAADACSPELASDKTSVVGSSSSSKQHNTETNPMKIRIDGQDIEMTEANAGLIQSSIDRLASNAQAKHDSAVSAERAKTESVQKDLDAASKRLDHAKANVAAFVEHMDSGIKVPCPFCDAMTPGKLTKLDGSAEDCGACVGKGEMPSALLGAIDVSALKGDKLFAEPARLDAASQVRLDSERGERGVKLSRAIRDHVDHAVDHSVAKRAALKLIAERALGAEEAAKLDGKSELEVKRAIVAAKKSTLKLDGKDAAYINAAFDTVVVDLPTHVDQIRGLVNPVGPSAFAPRADGGNSSAKQRMNERNANAWKRQTESAK